jgi:hypothetical protein
MRELSSREVEFWGLPLLHALSALLPEGELPRLLREHEAECALRPEKRQETRQLGHALIQCARLAALGFAPET